MKKGLFFYITLSIICAKTSLCQQLPRGTLIDLKEEKPLPITFKQEPNQNDNTTTYTIIQDGSNIYEINFAYFPKPADSIAIRFYDKKAGSLSTRFVKFNSSFDSHVIIKNYSLNEDSINPLETYSILFSLDENFLVTLYKFRAAGDADKLFTLQTTISPQVLHRHDSALHVFKNYKEMVEGKEQRRKDIVANMRRYRDAVIHAIDLEEKTKRSRLANIVADDGLQQKFKDQIEPFFQQQFKDLVRFESDSFTVDFTFYCDGYGKIQNVEFARDEKRLWFIDSIFNSKVKSLIQDGSYETQMDEMKHPTLVSDFMEHFTDSLKKAEIDLKDFRSAGESISAELATEQLRKIYLPSKFTYRFKYKSILQQETLRFLVDYNGVESLRLKEGDQQFFQNHYDKLLPLFKKTFSPAEGKKIDVQLCEVFVNDQNKGLYIRSLQTQSLQN